MEPQDPWRSLFFAFAIAAAIFILITGYFTSVLFWYPNERSLREIRAVEDGVAQELSYLQQQGDEVAISPNVIAAIRSYDALQTLTVLTQEKDLRGIGLMRAADKDGYVISRTLTTTARGDNIFLTSPMGRAMFAGLARGSSVETTTFSPEQVVLQSSRWVFDGGEKIGALTANNLADDSYTHRFARHYLAPGTEIAFYTKEGGIYGSSFDVEADRLLLSAFISPNSRFIKEHMDSRRIQMTDGRQYLVRNISFPGIEKTDKTGALILIPIGRSGTVINFLVLPALVFAGLGFFLHRHRRSERFLDLRHLLLMAGSALFLVLTIGCYYFLQNSFTPVRGDRYPLYNSILRVQPSADTYRTGTPHDITVFLDSGGEAINAISTTVSVDPAIVDIESIDTEQSICMHFVTRSMDVAAGTISIECIIPSPGFVGNNGIVAVFRLHGRVPGISEVHLSDASQVMANDGLATNVLRTTVSGTVRYTSETDAQGAAVYSPTQPNAASWYSSRRVSLVWLHEGAVTIRVAREDAPLAIQTFAAAHPPFVYHAEGDGVYIFSVSGAMGTSEMRVHIDATPPDPVAITASETSVSRGSVVRLVLSAADVMSGLQRTSYVRIDDQLFYPAGREIFVPLFEIGKHTVTVRVFDNAGNFVDKAVDIFVAR